MTKHFIQITCIGILVYVAWAAQSGAASAVAAMMAVVAAPDLYVTARRLLKSSRSKDKA